MLCVIHSHLAQAMRHTQDLCSYLAGQPSLKHAILSGGVVKAGVVSKLVQVCFGDDGVRAETYKRKLQLKEVKDAISAVVPEDDERHYFSCLFRVGE